MMKTKSVHEFDHTANWMAKVRNVSRLGSQFLGGQVTDFKLAGVTEIADAAGDAVGRRLTTDG
jgi:hypothetical protein